MGRTTLSKHKYKRLALESLRNSLRLLRDSVRLFNAGAYPTAAQIVILAIEELSKARAIDHVYESAVTNEGFLGEVDEQKWLMAMHSHVIKQTWHLRDWFWEFSPKFRKLITSGGLERLKQDATYVGLPKSGKLIDVNARVSVPWRIGEDQAKQLISLLCKEFRDIYSMTGPEYGGFFSINDLNDLILSHEITPAYQWPHKRTGLKSPKFARPQK